MIRKYIYQGDKGDQGVKGDNGMKVSIFLIQKMYAQKTYAKKM